MSSLIKLAANASRGQRRYVCLAGAGLSRDAGLPTAWDVMMSLAGMLRIADGAEEDGLDLEPWFLQSRYAKLSYSQLVEMIYPTSAGQRDLFREMLRVPAPGEAHRRLAELARLGVLRCIITTNFDNLIERALIEAGLDIQVVADDELLRSSGPLIQCDEFRIYKPHGTIEGGTLRNTPADLARLSGPFEEELSRVISDHGLIVLGYAGEDPGIRRVFANKQQYLYPTFWVNPSPPREGIPAMLGSGTFDHVPCKGASAFIDDLLRMYRKLDEIDQTTGLESVAREAEDAVRRGRKDAAATIARFWKKLDSDLEGLNPAKIQQHYDHPPGHEVFLAAIDETVHANLAFIVVAEAVAEMGSRTGARALFDGFGLAAAHYRAPLHIGGYGEGHFGFWRFVGHELFVSFVACLIRSGRWKLVTEVLGREFFLENPRSHKSGMHGYECLSDFASFFEVIDRASGGSGRWAHAEKLNERHKDGPLAVSLPIREFVEADYLLGLRSAFGGSYDPMHFDCRWTPFSYLVNHWTPKYLFAAESVEGSKRLFPVLGASCVENLRNKFKMARGVIARGAGSFHAGRIVEQFAEDRLGSR